MTSAEPTGFSAFTRAESGASEATETTSGAFELHVKCRGDGTTFGVERLRVEGALGSGRGKQRARRRDLDARDGTRAAWSGRLAGIRIIGAAAGERDEHEERAQESKAPDEVGHD